MGGTSTGVALRKAGLQDIPAIVAVQAASWRSAYRGIVDQAFLDAIPMAQWIESWRAHFFAGDTHAFVAEDAGRIVGFASVGRPEPPEGQPSSVAELHTIYIDAAHLGQGVGRLLMDAALDHLRSEGYAEAVLWVLEQNQRGRDFYERGGWVADGASAADCWGATSVPRVRYRRTLADEPGAEAAKPPPG